MTNKTDITYGIPAEVWPRDYSNVEKALMFWRKSLIPVRVTMEDGQVFCMYVQGLMSSRNKVDLCPAPFDKENRIRLPLERISTIESGVTEGIAHDFTGRTTYTQTMWTIGHLAVISLKFVARLMRCRSL